MAEKLFILLRRFGILDKVTTRCRDLGEDKQFGETSFNKY